MYIVIAGCGRVGARLATDLADDGHDVVVIDSDGATFSNLGATFNGMTVSGNAIDEDILRSAGIEKADAFAAATSHDSVNIMAAQIARQVFGVPRVGVRVSEPKREAVLREFQLDTVCAANLAADQFRTLLLKEGIHHRAYLGSAEVAQVEIGVNAQHGDLSPADLELPERVRLVSVIRQGRAFIPSADYHTQEGDTIIAAVRVDALGTIENRFMGTGRGK
jgi:trk system potassium uptake protein TrkA